jgi:hypothetical protein
MANKKGVHPFLLLLGVFLAGGLALFAASRPVRAEPVEENLATYEILWQVFANCGSLNATSTNFTMMSTFGQPAVGEADSAAYDMCSGLR